MNALGDQLLPQLAKILHLDHILSLIPTECNQLILIPHRYLHLFPLHALPLPKDRQSCLLDRFREGVRYAPSCQLLQLTRNQQRPNFNHLFAIQNPKNSGRDLPYTDIEVATIQQHFQPRDVFKKADAKKDAIDDERLRSAHCAHFSCHGYFNLESPLLSALLLADCKIFPAPADPDPSRYLPLQDGGAIDLTKCLTLGDIFDRTFDLRQGRLVTLSACETGLTDFTSLSDEYIGLPSGFLFAGSPSVVSSLWAVSDLSTAFLMIKFYENLRTSSTVVIALNQAQQWLRDATKEKLEQWTEERNLPLSPTQEIDLLAWLSKMEATTKPFEKPYYWAAFCAIGQ